MTNRERLLAAFTEALGAHSYALDEDSLREVTVTVYLNSSGTVYGTDFNIRLSKRAEDRVRRTELVR